eukprot:804709-Rhodomonas_salina.1
MSGTDITFPLCHTSCLRYAMSGTDMAYCAATRLQRRLEMSCFSAKETWIRQASPQRIMKKERTKVEN